METDSSAVQGGTATVDANASVLSDTASTPNKTSDPTLAGNAASLGSPGKKEVAPVESNENWEKKYREVYESYVRLAADFENHRKRTLQEQETQRKYGAEHTLRAFFPALDNLERASSSLSETSEPKMLYQSFRLIHTQMMDALKTLGLTPIEAVGKPFDPNYHEAVMQVERDDHPEHTVVTEMQSGFLLHDKVLRPAMVAVSTKAASTPEENPFKAG